MVALVAAVARLAVDDSSALTALQFALVVIFLTYVVLLLDVAAAAPSPGANDNASGVAAMLEVGPSPGGRRARAGRDVGRVHRSGRRRAHSACANGSKRTADRCAASRPTS